MSSESAPTFENRQSADDIDRLRERLTYYESFDQLIQTNVAQAGQLLRDAIEMREAAAHDAGASSQHLQDIRNQNLQKHRALYSTMLDEVTLLQGHAERLARRLTDAIDSLEAQLPPETDFPPLPATLTTEMISSLDEAEEQPAVELEQPSAPAAAHETALQGEQPDETAINGQELEEVVQPVALASGNSSQRTTALDMTPDDFVALDAAQPHGRFGEDPVTVSDHIDHPDVSNQSPGAGVLSDSPRPGQFILLMHGVPRAATALSLKQYLERLEQVQSVEPREFAAGVLRLQLRVSRDLSVNDLTSWPSGHDLAMIHSRSGLLEIQMQ